MLTINFQEIARQKTHPTTGFSGTNDSKYMLPTPIKQCELPEQLSTNAEVLACLLQEENKYDTEYAPQTETLDAATLLEIAVKMDPPVRVLLDVGAQLLEDNEKIASSWLGRVDLEAIQAVIFFHNNDIFVLNREGMKEPLLVSPFAKQMDRCLVYLDEAHTVSSTYLRRVYIRSRTDTFQIFLMQHTLRLKWNVY